MRLARSILFVTLALFLAAGMSAGAQTDLEEAEQEFEAAESDKAAAEQELGTARDRRDLFGDELAATLYEYQQTNARIEHLAQSVAVLYHEIDIQEDRVTELRERSRDRAVDAYMRNVDGSLAPFFLAGSFAEVGLVNEVAASQVELDTDAAEELDLARSELEALRQQYDGQRRELDGLRLQLDLQRDELELLFAAADERVLQAFRTLDEADAAYEQALERLEEERRKRRWTGSVEQWRPLVQQYFPADRVDEAMSVMWCESRGNPDAKNPTSSATGLFQFLKGTWAWSSVEAGWSGYSRLDPEANIAVAAWLVDYSIRTGHPGGAWGHWECQP